MGRKEVVRTRVGEMEAGAAELDQSWETKARRLEQLCRKTCPPVHVTENPIHTVARKQRVQSKNDEATPERHARRTDGCCDNMLKLQETFQR